MYEFELHSNAPIILMMIFQFLSVLPMEIVGANQDFLIKVLLFLIIIVVVDRCYTLNKRFSTNYGQICKFSKLSEFV